MDRYFVWLVAVLASLEAVGQAAQGLLDRKLGHLILWASISAAIILATGALEAFKSRRIG
jgi:hypothetical protein